MEVAEEVDEMSVKVKEANGVLDELFGRYSLDEVAFAFNGGKDSCVVLQLLHQYLGSRLSQVLCVHFVHDDEFEEVLSFVACTSERLQLNMMTSHMALRDGLWKLHRENTKLKAFVLGRRKSDPRAQHEKHFTAATEGWPPFVRVAPIMNWTYGNVWKYLMKTNAPYPELYKRGYTSLGLKTNTRPNPNLLNDDGTYRHASLLQNEEQERDSRM